MTRTKLSRWNSAAARCANPGWAGSLHSVPFGSPGQQAAGQGSRTNTVSQTVECKSKCVRGEQTNVWSSTHTSSMPGIPASACSRSRSATTSGESYRHLPRQPSCSVWGSRRLTGCCDSACVTKTTTPGPKRPKSPTCARSWDKTRRPRGLFGSRVSAAAGKRADGQPPRLSRALLPRRAARPPPIPREQIHIYIVYSRSSTTIDTFA